jgi:transglutaminase-like putative cysteine protease
MTVPRLQPAHWPFVAVVVFAAVPLRADEGAPPTSLDPESPCRAERLEPVTYDVDFAVVVTPPHNAKVLKVWLPLPPTDFAQQIDQRRLSTFPQRVEPRIAREPVYGNEFAYFEFHDPKGAQIIRHAFRARVWELRWNVDPARVAAPARWPEGFDRYLRPPAQVAEDAEFAKLLRELVPRSEGAARDLATVMAWIERNIKYDHVRASLKADAAHALAERRGHCSDYHGLCAAMGRSLGYPTRVTYGLNLFPKSSPSHCKLEAYLPPYGWVSYDLSETQKLVANIEKAEGLSDAEKGRLAGLARARLLDGFRDNTWLRVTQGTDYELAPPAARPVRVVRTIYAEADGEALPDPDPANGEKREFAWMTAHEFKADRQAAYPFADYGTLLQESPRPAP